MAEPVEPQQTDRAQIEQWMTRKNPPGLSKLVYRGGRYGRAVREMLAQVPVQSSGGEGEPAASPPLAALNTEAPNDWTVALVRAWAAVTEVLGFYQERFINEGYLTTATERRSVLELARTIGYELEPGVAASADLAFTVLTSREELSRQILIPAGTPVQSVPAPGERPQTFETSAEFAARSEWNALRLAHIQAGSWPQCPPKEARSARLKGVDTRVQPGGTILIVGALAPDAPERPWLLAQVKTVQPFPELGYTLVTWEEPLAAAGGQPFRSPQAFVMRQQAALFGYTPGGVLTRIKPDSGTGTETNWAPAAIGLPQAAVHALAGNAQGTLFAGTGQGLYRSADQGASWQPVSVGLVQKEIHALSPDPEGRLLAGTDDGHIYLSKDGGEKWAALSGEEVVLPPRGLAKLWSRGKAPLPKTVVRSLLTYARGRKRPLVAATDGGVFRSRDRGKTWQPANEDLPETDPKTGLASIVAWDLAVTKRGKKGELYAGTDKGVFHIRERIPLWPALAVGLAVLCLLIITMPQPVERIAGAIRPEMPKALQDQATNLEEMTQVLQDLATTSEEMTKALQDQATNSEKMTKALQDQATNPEEMPKALQDQATNLEEMTQVLQDLVRNSEEMTQVLQDQAKNVEETTLVQNLATNSEEMTQVLRDLAANSEEMTPVLQDQATNSEEITPVLLDLATNSEEMTPVLLDLATNSEEMTKALQELVTDLEKMTQVLQDQATSLEEMLVIVLPIGVVVGAAILAGLVVGAVMLGVRLLVRYASQHPPISLGKPVRALAAGKQGQLFAGTEQGLYRSNDGSAGGVLRRMGHRLARFLLGDLARRWQPVNGGLTDKDIRALVVDAAGDLLAGTAGGSVYRSGDNGDSWEPLGTDLSLKPIQAVWATEGRIFASGPPSDSRVESRWSPFQVRQKLVDLDQVYPEFSPDSWVVLRHAQETSPIPYQVTEVEVAGSQDPAKPGRFTRVTVDRGDRLEDFDRALTVVGIRSEALGLLSDRPLDGNKLVFDRYVPGLQPGQRLIVSGKRQRARFLRRDEDLKLVSDDGLQSVDLDVEVTHQVLGVRDGTTPGTKQWRLKTRAGFVGTAAAGDQVRWEPAADGDEFINELVGIETVKDLPANTVVTLTSALANLYDWTTVTVYGNVVEATHGQTVERELLGSSQGLTAHQRFLLKQPPLTYTAAATGSGVESTLKIEINGVRWKEVTSLDELDRDKGTFMLRQDDQGNTAVLFGFGPHDTGIPRGAEQISATYRQGLGSEGNVAAGSLRVLQTAPPGLKGVINPLAACGGADPETMANAQEQAPISVRAVDRIVSLSDYEDFSRQFAGIGKAQARLISRGRQQWLHITIADTAGNEVAHDSDLYKNLTDAIRHARASSVPRVVIHSYEPVYFCLKATVWVKRDHQARMAEIRQEATRKLKGAFAFERRAFGQPVSAAEVITLIQGIPGVFAVKLEQLYRHRETAEPCPLLTAEVARWDADGLHPAQMLVIEPTDGIKLDLEIAP